MKNDFVTIVRLAQDGDELYYVAQHPEIEQCMGTGDTPEEAIQDLASVTEMVLEHLREHNLPIPAPGFITTLEEVDPTPEVRQHIIADVPPRLEITPLPFAFA